MLAAFIQVISEKSPQNSVKLEKIHLMHDVNVTKKYIFKSYSEDMLIRWPTAELLALKQSVKSTVTYLVEIRGEQRPVRQCD